MDMAPLDTWIRTGEVIIGGVRIIGFQRGSQMSWFQWTRFHGRGSPKGHLKAEATIIQNVTKYTATRVSIPQAKQRNEVHPNSTQGNKYFVSV